MTLEEILQKYFNCKKPFKKNGTLTKNGVIAFNKLEALLVDLQDVTRCYVGIDDVIQELDKILNEN